MKSTANGQKHPKFSMSFSLLNKQTQPYSSNLDLKSVITKWMPLNHTLEDELSSLNDHTCKSR